MACRCRNRESNRPASNVLYRLSTLTKPPQLLWEVDRRATRHQQSVLITTCRIQAKKAQGGKSESQFGGQSCAEEFVGGNEACKSNLSHPVVW